MNRLSDAELRHQLERRVSASPLAHAHRDETLATIRARVAQTRQGRHAGLFRFGRWAVAAAAGTAVVLLVAAVALRLPTDERSPAQPSPSAALPSVAQPSASPLPDGLEIRVLTAQELATVVAGGDATGRIVIAEVQVGDAVLARCRQPENCWIVTIEHVEPVFSFAVAGNERPSDGVMAFRVLSDGARHLGSVALNDGEPVWQVREVRVLAGSIGAQNSLFAVEGWLSRTAVISCPAPQDNDGGSLDYWCGGSWLTAENERTTYSFSDHPRALRVQWHAYESFAPDPDATVRGAEPRHGTYLVRVAGCPGAVMGECPVWEMLGRIEASVLANAPTPSPTADGTPDRSLVDAVALAQARAVLDQWEQAVKAAPEGAIAFTGYVLHGGGWRGPDADEQKSAFLSGLIEASVELPTDIPLPSDVVWEDGSRATVPLLSAAEAFEEMRRDLVGGSCPNCRPLEVVGARLITRGAETSRGWADVPAWEFAFAGRDAPTVPITQVAVRHRIDVPRTEDVARFMGYALGTPDSTSLTVAFAGSACGPDHYAAEAVESAVGVVVLVQPDPPPPPDATPRICIALAVGRTAVVELDAPLGSRTVLDPVSGQPIPVYAELPEDGFPRP